MELGHDLFVAGHRTADQWRQWVDAAYPESVAHVHPGDLGYDIFGVEVLIGAKPEKVWFQQIDDDSACMYYPREY